MARGSRRRAAATAVRRGFAVRGRVLVAHADPSTRREMARQLTHAGYRVLTSGDSDSVLTLLHGERFDLVVLDLSLPPGLALLDLIVKTRATPVVAIPAEPGAEHRVEAFDHGAEDVLPEPWSTAELVRRVQHVLRAHGRSANDVLERGVLRIDITLGLATVAGHALDLTVRELELLAFLAMTPGRVYSSAQLLRAVWHSDPEWQTTQTVVEHVSRLRRKLGPVPDGREWIETVRGLGYRFRGPGPGS